ncbi:Med5-domain-containing protein [Eremomyces bilateralis CBS 781.70]|uniref:Mediator of RNA polymerase II transcription subunit 5 n=1 Tax=Eremomyces bilateralis CBS 781.70 TaxID=1392243 RepID=A0A6G1G8X0_9PEZI|nr:Med5-domain-containing protein [Eremomyces bilateralis CBS 781.70]KAF1814494.1 Med5-domain-containing protein [Eremomyces bilateralis CBS 781.70]
MDTILQEWQCLIQSWFARRADASEILEDAQKLELKYPIRGRRVAELIIAESSDGNEDEIRLMDWSGDIYVRTLLRAGRIDIADVLGALLVRSKTYHAAFSRPDFELPNSKSNAMDLESRIFLTLTRALISGPHPRRQMELTDFLRFLAKYMSAAATTSVETALLDPLTREYRWAEDRQHRFRDRLGTLAVTTLEHGKVIRFLMDSKREKIHRELAEALTLFVPVYAQISPNTADRLGLAQRQSTLVQEGEEGEMDHGDIDVAALHVDAVVDLQTIYSRAGLYVFISALMSGRPLMGDNLILNYLNVRYKNDMQAAAETTTALIVASFDVLSTAMKRTGHNESMFSLRSFMINKLPVLISILSTSTYPPLSVELCITEAFRLIRPNAFPSFSDSFMEAGNNVMADVRQDFLFACIMHRLIVPQSLERLLTVDERPMSDPPSPSKLYSKDLLLSQCSSNPERAEEIVGELEDLDGNAGAIVEALVELIRNMCNTKETLSLKSICNALSRRRIALDVVFQFTSPASILQPLCHLLDTWRYEEDASEFQPVYDEFAGIFLLVLALVYRFGLTHQEMGIAQDSFVTRFLENDHISYSMEELEGNQKTHLSAWIKALFDPEGNIDEVMATCRPQEFYMLMPTIFGQVVAAAAADIISIDAVKSGLDYILETFLLPSLVAAFSWMAGHGFEQTPNGAAIIIQILQKLFRSPSSSGDAPSMHATVLSISTSKLERLLLHYRRNLPSVQEIPALTELLKPHLHFERSRMHQLGELDSWTSAPHNLLVSIRSVVQSLANMDSSENEMVPSPQYNHRQLLLTVQILGAARVLQTIVDEVKHQTEFGRGAIALDVATSIICAPGLASHVSADPHGSLPSGAVNCLLSLRDALTLMRDQAKSMVKQKDLLGAETVVRLSRRVEAQMVPPAPATAVDGLGAAQMLQPLDLAGTGEAPSTEQITRQALDFTSDAATAAANAAAMDLDPGATDMDLAQDMAANANFPTNEDDVFAGLLDASMDDLQFDADGTSGF